ncbi:Hypothetical protein RG540_PA08200 (plasmid) [Neorhizobium galegae bv. orientalis str. HAMBI 540]|uniref:Uncharacterized protein n=1 Tax=Neorhizobium galegae bv. orientalis str. HAMBI 540 TaxID=1028800 RepID=A0A068T0A1_NEOGA|nr:Hypothetical protein RG540_PA08200 [Neorhizobium galegae bv. orientalis str. HAMBI 540]
MIVIHSSRLVDRPRCREKAARGRLIGGISAFAQWLPRSWRCHRWTIPKDARCDGCHNAFGMDVGVPRSARQVIFPKLVVGCQPAVDTRRSRLLSKPRRAIFLPCDGRKSGWAGSEHQFRIIDIVRSVAIIADETDPFAAPFQPHDVGRFRVALGAENGDDLPALQPGGDKPYFVALGVDREEQTDVCSAGAQRVRGLLKFHVLGEERAQTIPVPLVEQRNVAHRGRGGCRPVRKRDALSIDLPEPRTPRARCPFTASIVMPSKQAISAKGSSSTSFNITARRCRTGSSWNRDTAVCIASSCIRLSKGSRLISSTTFSAASTGSAARIARPRNKSKARLWAILNNQARGCGASYRSSRATRALAKVS